MCQKGYRNNSWVCIDQNQYLSKIPPKHLFLLDSIGGGSSAILLLLLGEYFLMPLNILSILVGIAVFYAIYSGSCFYLMVRGKITNWQRYMRFIAVANLFYCCLTLGLGVYYYAALSNFGVVYFMAEIAIIGCLAAIEWRLTIG